MFASAVQPAVFCLNCHHLEVLTPREVSAPAGTRVVCTRCQTVLVEKISGEDHARDLD
ncbi:MAG: hypothetical protein HY319_28290 [Armatimonadetes bacterium]|nr:hypothetical protein [Armatimonadota bacterium]